MNYRKIWEEFNDKKIPEGYEIHHMDGNHRNNDPQNLLCVSIQEHLDIHYHQQDWGAVQAILIRMNYQKDDLSHAAREAQKKRMKENKHNFQKISVTERSEISKKIMEKRLNEHGVAFLGIKDTVENSRHAGNVAADKKAGFLNTNSNNHGSKHVKGTHWWTNSNTGEKIRAKEAPNKDWKRGMLK